jgi:hypothetical protein
MVKILMNENCSLEASFLGNLIPLLNQYKNLNDGIALLMH